MYEAVTVEPETRTTPARFASTAARYGYNGIVFRGTNSPEALGTLADAYDIDVVNATTIDATSRDEAAHAIEQARPETELLAARARDETMSRFLAERERIDVLVPDGPIEHTTAKIARDHGIAFELDLGPLLRTREADRVAAMRQRTRLGRILTHFDVPYVVTATPRSHLQLRSPRALQAIGSSIGLDPDAISTGLGQWGTIAARTRRNRDDKFIEPGVRILDDETDAE